MTRVSTKFLGLSLVLAAAGSARAFDFGADWTYLYWPEAVTFETNYAGWSGPQAQVTSLFKGDRRTGPDGGTTTLLPAGPYSVLSYCVEIGQAIHQSYERHDKVTNLLGSVTNTGGVTGPITFTAAKTDALERLWGSFFSSVTDKTHSAAFQLAVWELTFDSDQTLTNVNGKLYKPGSYTAGSIYAIAEAYLTDVRTGKANKRQALVLLSDKDVQDQITAVPEPASLVIAGLGAAALLGARRVRKA